MPIIGKEIVVQDNHHPSAAPKACGNHTTHRGVESEKLETTGVSRDEHMKGSGS